MRWGCPRAGSRGRAGAPAGGPAGPCAGPAAPAPAARLPGVSRVVASPARWRGGGVVGGARWGCRCGARRASFAVSLPRDEGELLAQVQTSVAAALADGLPLLEVEAPLMSGLGVNTGDSIAISEYNANQQMLRRFARHWEVRTPTLLRTPVPGRSTSLTLLAPCRF